jgi:hypothetical protein
MSLSLVSSTYFKKCASCNTEYTVEYFHKNKQQADGYSCYCLTCTKNKNQKKYKKSAENHLWKLEQTLKASKERAARKNLEHTLTIEDIQELYPKDNICPILGITLSWGFPKDTSPSLDRIDSSKGYTYENCQIVSNRANRIKSDATIEELELLLNYLKETYLV